MHLSVFDSLFGRPKEVHLENQIKDALVNYNILVDDPDAFRQLDWAKIATVVNPIIHEARAKKAHQNDIHNRICEARTADPDFGFRTFREVRNWICAKDVLVYKSLRVIFAWDDTLNILSHWKCPSYDSKGSDWSIELPDLSTPSYHTKLKYASILTFSHDVEGWYIQDTWPDVWRLRDGEITVNEINQLQSIWERLPNTGWVGEPSELPEELTRRWNKHLDWCIQIEGVHIREKERIRKRQAYEAKQRLRLLNRTRKRALATKSPEIAMIYAASQLTKGKAKYG